MKRKQAELLEQQQIAMIAAVWSNSNWDDPKTNPREAFAEAMEKETQKRLAELYGKEVEGEEEEFEIDPNDPFWAAMYKNLEKQHGTAKPTKKEIERALEKDQVSSNLDKEEEMTFDQMEDD